METKFKIGDRVLINCCQSGTVFNNTTGTVMYKVTGDLPIVVKVDNFNDGHFGARPSEIKEGAYQDLGTNGWCFTADKLSHLTENKSNNNQMKYFKTKEISVVKKSDNETTTVPRSITVCVVVDGSNVNTGYAVRRMDDEPNVELAKRISLGRANNTKTNLTKGMLITLQLTEKYILAAIANKVLADIENGTIVIKGIRN